MEASINQTVERARKARGSELEQLLYHRSGEVVEALLENPGLREQHLTILLGRQDLPREAVTVIARNKQWMSSYPLKVAVLKHPRTPRHLALPLLKFIFPFDLLEIGRTPGVAPEVKRLTEENLLAQRESLPAGQRVSLARRGSPRIAGALLSDPDSRVIQAALDNPALTEQFVAAALLAERTPAELTTAVLEHPRWSVRRGVKLALARNRHLSLARFATLLAEMTAGELRDLADDPRVAPNIRSYVGKLFQIRRTPTKKWGV